MTATNLRRLGVLHSSLMALLPRNPSQRPSMEQFCETCTIVLAGSTTLQV